MLSEALPSSAEAPPAAASPDQAAGLRRWMAAMTLGAAGAGNGADESPCPQPAVESVPEPAPALAPDPASAAQRDTAPCTLMVLGLGESRSGHAAEVLEAWARAGQRWVGDPARWRIVAVDAASPQLAPLYAQQPRWALWVEGEGDAFRRAYRVLRQLAAAGGPRRLLALHPPGWPRRGLLANLQQVAASCLDIELVVLAR